MKHVITIALVAATSNCFAANLLVNGSFEDGGTNGGVVFTTTDLTGGNNVGFTPTGWDISAVDLDEGSAIAGNPNLVLEDPTYIDGPPIAQEGRVYYDAADSGGILSQTFTLDESSVVTYGGFFSARNIRLPDGQGGEIRELQFDPSTIAIFSLENGIETLVTSIETIIPDNLTLDFVETASQTDVLDAGEYIFRVSIGDSANVDNLSVEVVTPATVPEPSALGLLALGSIGLVVRRQRNK